MRIAAKLVCLILLLGLLPFVQIEMQDPAPCAADDREDSTRNDSIWIEATKYGEYVVLYDDIWEIDSQSDFYVHFDFDADLSSIDFWIYSIYEKRDNNQDGLLDGNWTYFPSNRTLYFKPGHIMFHQRLQDIPEYTINIGKGLKTTQGDPVLDKDFNLSVKIAELNSDGDDMPDSRDPFPYDPTQMLDSDADGYGDNISGTNPDFFPSDKTQWRDTDGDGHGDNASGHLGDQFPNDPAAWQDTDSDGKPDDIDPSHTTDLVEDLDDDNDGFTDVDELDLQTDPKNSNSFPPDTDGDGKPDGKDSDIDNDGYSNKEEEEAGTDPYDPNDHPSLFLPVLIIFAVVILALIVAVPIVWLLKTKNETKTPEQVGVEGKRGAGGRVRPGRPAQRTRRYVISS